MAKVGRLWVPDSGPIGKLKDLFTMFATSVNDAMPVKLVKTLAELNAITINADTAPRGTMAILIADDSGLASGSQFVARADDHWHLAASCTAINVDTFVSSLQTYTNIRTMVGANCWDLAKAQMVTFVAFNGTYTAVTTKKTASGKGNTLANLYSGQTVSFQIAFPPGTFDATPSQIFVTADSTRPQCTAVNRTKDGFTAQLSNWSPAGMPVGVGYYWMAFA